MATSTTFQMTRERALAVAVGEVAGDGAEDGPGGVEEDRHQRDGAVSVSVPRVDGEEHGRGVDGLVVEGGEELGDEQPMKVRECRWSAG